MGSLAILHPFPVPALAAEELPHRPVTLEDCYRMALKQSEEIAVQAELRLRQARRRAAQEIRDAHAEYQGALVLGPGAETRIPMAITVIGGITLSTLLTLLVVPCAYSLFSRWEHKKYAPSPMPSVIPPKGGIGPPLSRG